MTKLLGWAVIMLLCGAASTQMHITEIDFIQRLFVKERNTTLTAISSNCMRCICEVEGCEHQIGKCQMDVGSLSCGPFQIKEDYWNDCGKPGTDWQSCTKQMPCSQTCVSNYMARFGTYCTGGRTPTCRDYAMIHNGGPFGCRKGLEAYWAKVKRCCEVKFGGRC